MSKIDIRSMYLPELENYLSEMGEPRLSRKADISLAAVGRYRF